jgi:uncharacterized protein YkwD
LYALLALTVVLLLGTGTAAAWLFFQTWELRERLAAAERKAEEDAVALGALNKRLAVAERKNQEPTLQPKSPSESVGKAVEPVAQKEDLKAPLPPGPPGPKDPPTTEEKPTPGASPAPEMPPPVDPRPRIAYQLGPQMQVGLAVLSFDEKKALPSDVAMLPEEKAVLDLTNQERKRAKLAPLKSNQKLCWIARAHSQNMARRNIYSHVLDGKTPSDRARDVGYPEGVAENAFRGPPTAADAMRGWMNSKGHRENILGAGFTEFGVGVAQDRNGQRYWTQVFGAAPDSGRVWSITFAPDGSTGNTVIRLDDKEIFFGADTGMWTTRKEALPPRPAGSWRHGHRAVWAWDQVEITKTVEIVPAGHAVKTAYGHVRLLNTCLITYQIENKGGKPRTVGLRELVDTLIGTNNGHPFAVPGKQGTITTQADFRGAGEMPEHVQALERDDADSPGLVAHFTLKVGGPLEVPDRCSITRWPGEKCGWQVPVRNIGGDAAVALYWDPVQLKAGGRRLLGFAYGQGLATLEPAKSK